MTAGEAVAIAASSQFFDDSMTSEAAPIACHGMRSRAILFLRTAGHSMSALHCLRCKTTALQEDDHYPEIRFFLCPRCGRRYALEPGRQLTFRWLHPVTLALQAVIFDAEPVPRAPEIAQKFAAQKSRAQLDEIVKEIRLELDDPTQQVRDSLDCRASEEKLRLYLASFCECLDRLRWQTQRPSEAHPGESEP